MNKTDKLHERRVGLRWGRLLAAITAAKDCLELAHDGRSLLPAKLRDHLDDVESGLIGLEQQVWMAERKAAE